MVHLTKAFIITTIAIVPVLAAPTPFGQADVELMAREPVFQNVKNTYHRVVNNPTVQKVASGVQSVASKAAPLMSMLPGKMGHVGYVASVLTGRELEDPLSARAIQDELDARGYDFNDSIDLEARRRLEVHQLADSSDQFD